MIFDGVAVHLDDFVPQEIAVFVRYFDFIDLPLQVGIEMGYLLIVVLVSEPMELLIQVERACS